MLVLAQVLKLVNELIRLLLKTPTFARRHIILFLVAVVSLWGVWPNALLVISTASSWLAVECVFFWRMKVPAVVDSSQRTWRYPRHRRWAKRGCLGFATLAVITTGTYVYHLQNEPSVMLVLVADFDGPEPQKYRVTEILINHLRRAMAPYKDVAVASLHKPITEADGAEVARSEGRQKGAAVVLWGWYGVGEKGIFPISAHVEALGATNPPDLGCDTVGAVQLCPMAGLSRFRIQENLSTKLSALTLAVVGFIRYEARDWSGAVSSLSNALTIGEMTRLTSRTQIHMKRGLAYVNNGQTQQGIDDFTRAIELDATWPAAFYYRGVSYMYVSDFAKAADDLRRSIELMPDYQEAHCMLAVAYDSLDDAEQAMHEAHKCVQLGPDDPRAYSNRCAFYNRLGNHLKAIPDCEEAVRLDPEWPEAYYNRGLARGLSGDAAGAKADFRVVSSQARNPTLREKARRQLELLGK